MKYRLVPHSTIDDIIGNWHSNPNRFDTLIEYLGWNEIEYNDYVTKKVIKEIYLIKDNS